jgi:hypothetical protein
VLKTGGYEGYDAIARKNLLFADTVRGAEVSANLYSLVETAKANDLELWPISNVSSSKSQESKYSKISTRTCPIESDCATTRSTERLLWRASTIAGDDTLRFAWSLL